MKIRNLTFIGLVFVLIIGALAFVIAGRGAARTIEPITAATSADSPKTSNVELLLLAAIAKESVDNRRFDALIDEKIARPAPALHDGEWINSAPTSLEKLRGQVVLVDFWTYGCYNCINTVPTLKRFDKTYRDKGLTIVGVETPESPSEKIVANVQKAVANHEIKYPVVMDANGDSWRAFDIEAWPTVVILDKQGRIRYSHVGEGAYDEQEAVIKTLLAENAEKASSTTGEKEYAGEKIVKTEAERGKELTNATSGKRTAVFAGGCFWGLEAVFEHLKGVSDVKSGYSGGAAKTANYEAVSNGDTGHAESVEIIYDPSQISYQQLLKVFFSVAHDPTELNRQGPDTGTQYRSAIFYTDEEQKRLAESYLTELTNAKVFDRPIVTQIAALNAFYPAEDYHQDYLAHHPTQPYIVINDQPKVENLQKRFPELYISN